MSTDWLGLLSGLSQEQYHKRNGLLLTLVTPWELPFWPLSFRVTIKNFSFRTFVLFFLFSCALLLLLLLSLLFLSLTVYIFPYVYLVLLIFHLVPHFITSSSSTHSNFTTLITKTHKYDRLNPSSPTPLQIPRAQPSLPRHRPRTRRSGHGRMPAPVDRPQRAE